MLSLLNETSYKKTNNLHYAKSKAQIEPSLIYLYPIFHACSLLLGLYRLVCVRPGWNLKLLVFSCDGLYIFSCQTMKVWWPSGSVVLWINPYLTNGFSHHYQLGESTFICRGVRMS